jgi:hypothetical protein
MATSTIANSDNIFNAIAVSSLFSRKMFMRSPCPLDDRSPTIIRLTSLEDVVDQVTCAGSTRLHTWCAKEGRGADDVALRVIHPLHPEAFVDVSCERVLAQECTGTSASPLEIDGPTGEAQQPATPLGFGCFLAATAIGTLGMFTCSRHPKDKYCDQNLWGSTIAMGAVCLLF